MSLLSLSNELLSNCFAFLETHKSDIGNLRLVSKRIHANASPFLVTKVHVSFDRESLRDLETLSKHPVFSKSVKSVQIDVSYYDKLLAESVFRFVEHNACDLYQMLDLMDRVVYNWYDDEGNVKEEYEEGDRLLEGARRMHTEWDRLQECLAHDNDAAEALRPNATEAQKILFHAHDEYIKLYNEQQESLENRQGIKRIVQALVGLTGPIHIILKDSYFSKPTKEDRNWTRKFETGDLKERCLRKGCWKGSFMTAMDTQPPVHIVSDLFTALAESPVRPTSFTIDVTAPADMRCVNFTVAQLDAVKIALIRAEELHFNVGRWARKDSFAENNDRPKEELAGLCTLITAFFSSQRTKSIHLGLGDYPCFYEIPTISLIDMIRTPLPSINILEITFQSIPFKLSDIQNLVDATENTLESLELNRPYLLDGKWADGLGVLRNLKKLEWVDFRYPLGGEYGERNSSNAPDIEQDVIEDYILRENAENPLQEFKRKEKVGGGQNESGEEE